VRFSQLASAHVLDHHAQATPRNLVGFKDGTPTSRRRRPRRRRHVWGPARRRAGVADRGSYSCPPDPDGDRDLGAPARRQEQIHGAQSDRAPFASDDEFATLDFSGRGTTADRCYRSSRRRLAHRAVTGAQLLAGVLVRRRQRPASGASTPASTSSLQARSRASSCASSSDSPAAQRRHQRNITHVRAACTRSRRACAAEGSGRDAARIVS